MLRLTFVVFGLLLVYPGGGIAGNSDGDVGSSGNGGTGGGQTVAQEVPKPTWSDSYMNSDPLAQFGIDEPSPPPPKQEPQGPPKKAGPTQVRKHHP